MQRALWKGTISFGLVNIAVEIVPAEKNDDLHFKLLDRRDHQKIHYSRVNETTGNEVPWKEIVKAYKYDDHYVEITDQEFKDLSTKNFKSIEIEHFVDTDEISPLFYLKPYYLIPEKTAEKAYVLLREVLKQTKKAAIAKLIIHNKQHLVAIMSCGNALVVETLRFPQQLVDRSNYNFPAEELESYRIHPKENEMATQLIENMSVRWNPSAYHDETQEVLINWIEQKAEKAGLDKEQASEKKSRSKAKNVADMMDLLKKSIDRKNIAHTRKTIGAKRQTRRTH